MIKWLGSKLRMTQFFTFNGESNAITIVKLITGFIFNINYLLNRIKVGYYLKGGKNFLNSHITLFEKLQLIPLKIIKEYSISGVNKFYFGQTLDSSQFTINEKICCSGLTIGKGFSGTCKIYNFRRGPMTHGSKNHKQPGAIGQGSTPGRVFPGKKLAGKFGTNKVTLRNLLIFDINFQKNLLLLKGNIMGTSKTNLFLTKLT